MLLDELKHELGRIVAGRGGGYFRARSSSSQCCAAIERNHAHALAMLDERAAGSGLRGACGDSAIRQRERADFAIMCFDASEWWADDDPRPS